MRTYRNRRTVFGFLILRKSGRASHIPRLNVLSGNYILASGDEAVDYYADLPSFTDDGYIIRQFGSQTMILGKTEDGLDRAVRYYLNSFINGESDYYVSGEDCMSHPGGFSEFPVSNIDYAAELSKWCEISTRVIVWLYPGTWYALPFASSTVFNLLEDMKFLNGLGVYGIFVCPSYESASDGVIPYVLSKLFWNCDISEEEYADMIKEYCNLQYGDGWENIYEYMLIQEHIKSDACWNTFAFSDTSLRENLEYYRDNFDYLIGLYEDAALLAQSSVQEYRILYHSLNMYYTGLFATYNSMYKNGSEAERTMYLERRNSFCEQTSDVVMSCGAGGATREYVDPFSDFDITADNPGVLSDSEYIVGRWYDIP